MYARTGEWKLRFKLESVDKSRQIRPLFLPKKYKQWLKKLSMLFLIEKPITHILFVSSAITVFRNCVKICLHAWHL